MEALRFFITRRYGRYPPTKKWLYGNLKYTGSLDQAGPRPPQKVQIYTKFNVVLNQLHFFKICVTC